MYSFVYEHRVRYRECDPMGVAYHTHYLDYFEAARTEALRPLGISYKEIEERGIFMPVISAEVKYAKPIYYDDIIEVTTLFPELPGFRLDTRYEIRRKAEEQVCATGGVVLCFIDATRRRPMKAPDFILDRIKAAWTDESRPS